MNVPIHVEPRLEFKTPWGKTPFLKNPAHLAKMLENVFFRSISPYDVVFRLLKHQPYKKKAHV